MSALPVSWTGQCCDGYCVDDIGVHNVEAAEAEYIAKAAGDLIAEAEERGAAKVREAVHGVLGYGTSWIPLDASLEAGNLCSDLIEQIQDAIESKP